MPIKYGLTDLERGKYLPGGTNSYSVVRVSTTLDVAGGNSGSSYVYKWRYFQAAGNVRDQNVNGSVTRVDYEIIFIGDTYLRRLDIVCAATNIVSTLDYGSISGGLPNGLQLIRYDGAIEKVMFNAQRWIEYGHFVEFFQFERSLIMIAATYYVSWNSDVVRALMDKFGDGRTGDFRVPGEFGRAVDITERNTTLFASDRDMFVFLADEVNRIEYLTRLLNGESLLQQAMVNSDNAVDHSGLLDRIVNQEEIRAKSPEETLGRLGKQILEAIIASPGSEMPASKGTLLGALNGVTYFVDHKRGRSEDSRGFQAAFGEGERLKTRALEIAMEMATKGA